MKIHYNIKIWHEVRAGSFRTGVRSGALAVLMASVSVHASTPTAGEAATTVIAQPVAVAADAALRERASLDPAKLAARADAIKAQRQRISAPAEEPALKALREQNQRALAQATTTEERENILAEYLAIQQALQAQKRLNTIHGKALTSRE